jgi:hypothetical protein
MMALLQKRQDLQLSGTQLAQPSRSWSPNLWQNRFFATDPRGEKIVSFNHLEKVESTEGAANTTVSGHDVMQLYAQHPASQGGQKPADKPAQEGQLDLSKPIESKTPANIKLAQDVQWYGNDGQLHRGFTSDGQAPRDGSMVIEYKS